eukprot:1179393-Prorocentrum_minimum.AAC.1
MAASVLYNVGRLGRTYGKCDAHRAKIRERIGDGADGTGAHFWWAMAKTTELTNETVVQGSV